MTIYCYYYIKNDPSKEKLGKILTGSRLEAAKEFGSLAQLVEQRLYTAKVGGSTPSGPTKLFDKHF